MILDCCRIIRIFSCPLLMTNWRKNYSFHLPAHRANVIIVVKVKCVQFTLKPLHYLTVPSHICSQDQHHNFLQRHNYIFSIKKNKLFHSLFIFALSRYSVLQMSHLANLFLVFFAHVAEYIAVRLIGMKIILITYTHAYLRTNFMILIRLLPWWLSKCRTHRNWLAC